MNSNKFSEFSNRLYFNIWDNEPHYLIKDFLNANIPWLKNQGKATWTAYPNQGETNLDYDNSTYELEFSKHPYFDGNYLSSVLFFNLRKIKEQTVGIVSVEVYFLFDKPEDCNYAFKNLCNIFQSFNSKEKNVGGNGPHVVFTNPEGLVWPYEVQLKVTMQNKNENKFKLTFIQGGFVD